MKKRLSLLLGAVLLLNGCSAQIIQNEPKPAPKFVIDPTVDDFYKFTRDSFTMEGYEYSDFAGKIPVAL